MTYDLRTNESLATQQVLLDASPLHEEFLALFRVKEIVSFHLNKLINTDYN